MAKSNSISKAKIAQVDFGFTKIDGLMLPDGSYAIATAQANELFSFASHPNYVNRSLKRILGANFTSVSIKSELHGTPVAILSLDNFKTLVHNCIKLGIILEMNGILLTANTKYSI